MKRIDFSVKTPSIDFPPLLSLQLDSFHKFVQANSDEKQRKKESLHKIFREMFPVTDVKGNFRLEFVDYFVEPPTYSPEECLADGLTYEAPLKAYFRLHCEDEEDQGPIDQKIFLGNIPYMTPQGSFIVKGVSRVIVPPIQRSYGVFFTQNKHTNGTTLFSAKIVPSRGTWLEIVTGITETIYAYVDRKKKIPVTLLLRAIGYSSDKDILDIFDLAEEFKVNRKILKQCKGRKLAGRLVKTWIDESVDQETGEVLSIQRSEVILERNTVLDDESIEAILEGDESTIILHKDESRYQEYAPLFNTFEKDTTNNSQEAIDEIYRLVRGAEPPDAQLAKELVTQIFFSQQRAYLGPVGRHFINKKLRIKIPKDTHVLTQQDIVATLKYFFRLMNGQEVPDDLDNLCNRRIRVVGELLNDVFSLAVTRLARVARDRMSVRGGEEFKPRDLVNAKIVGSALNSFFAVNPLSQLLDETNPLSQIAHKRKASLISSGGMAKERATPEMRDVNHSHFRRICIVETPEGINIGLIVSLALYSKVDDMGFIRTPYKKVIDKKVDQGKEVHYLAADEEDPAVIAEHTCARNAEGVLDDVEVKARQNGDFFFTPPEKINYLSVASNQVLSSSASLIPFIENNDASRALMGANMQRQAVPLLNPEAPIVGTGLEKRVVQDFKGIPAAIQDGVVTYVDAIKIIIEHKLPSVLAGIPETSPYKTYKLKRLKGTNHGTLIDLKPIVARGDRVKKGQILCEGYATQDGELALGRNVRIAFMSFDGYNFEDAIVISEKLVKDDAYTSIHIKDFRVQLINTKFGEEQFTSDIPSMSEDAVKNLDENGIIRVGVEVKGGDILAGKITPKGEEDLPVENQLLRAIFGEKAYNVKDTSLKAPPTFKGVVIKTQILSRANNTTKEDRQKTTEDLAKLKEEYDKRLDKLREAVILRLFDVLGKAEVEEVKDLDGKVILDGKTPLSYETISNNIFSRNMDGSNILPAARSITHISLSNKWAKELAVNKRVAILLNQYMQTQQQIIASYKKKKNKIEVGDTLLPGVLKEARIYVAVKRPFQVGDKMAGRHGNKGIIAKIAREEDMPFDENGERIEIVLSPLGLPSRMNIGQMNECLLGRAGAVLGRKYTVPVFEGPGYKVIEDELKEAGLPVSGRTRLYNGRTGKPFDQKITVGTMYMLKLHHLVDEKVHARSTGPYSLMTHQPLGGRAQRGGQRVGEMEAWALEAYGAAYNLQELFTVKSDDIEGRRRTAEAIVKGRNIPRPGKPETFNILKQTLHGLALEFGREEK
jgi:DNA-directed RNA polymerase subunit beta